MDQSTNVHNLSNTRCYFRISTGFRHLLWYALYRFVPFSTNYNFSSVDAFHNYDGGVRMVYGANATANLFATYPQDFLSTGSGFANEVND